MHSTTHPQAGKHFRINIDDGKSQAGFDQMLQNRLFQLLDWADRIDSNTSFTHRQKTVALEFFANRCQPNLPFPTDRSSLELHGSVYGSCKIEYDGLANDTIVVLREFELIGPEPLRNSET